MSITLKNLEGEIIAIVNPIAVPGVSGVWVNLVNKVTLPTLSFAIIEEDYKTQVQLAFYYDSQADACPNVSLTVDASGTWLLIRRGDAVKKVELFDLLTKLESL